MSASGQQLAQHRCATTCRAPTIEARKANFGKVAIWFQAVNGATEQAKAAEMAYASLTALGEQSASGGRNRRLAYPEAVVRERLDLAALRLADLASSSLV